MGLKISSKTDHNIDRIESLGRKFKIAFYFPSFLFILYLIMVLYRCICSRNYAEWRSSWNNPEIKAMHSYTQIVRESVPIELDGHKHEVECLGNDGNIVISLCLGGALNVWDSYTGEQISEASR